MQGLAAAAAASEGGGGGVEVNEADLVAALAQRCRGGQPVGDCGTCGGYSWNNGEKQ